MKNRHIKFLLFVLLTGSFFNTKSQVSFVKGYLINEKGDSLKGEIKLNPKKEHENHLKVFFKDASGTQKNYKPNKVKGYGYKNNHYVSINQDDEPRFYKRLTNGDILLYKSAFEVVNMNASSFDFEYYLFRNGDKKLTEVKQSKFKKQLQEWMSGAAAFASEYQEDKKFNEPSAIEVINKYNDWKKTN
ncbi:MAG: hypothetical protein H0W61_01505 [Bacteroidetes bacterium]|nr:hypothetical protein [Bacteroidota bacterium]